MSPYDSDDSLSDSQSYTETDVLLGYASKTTTGETISKLGGRPDWLNPLTPPSYTPTFQCGACKAPLVLLLQLHADLATRFPGHERRLYVFACRKKSCRRVEGSVRAVRATRVSSDALAKVKEREERAKREKAEEERREAERKEKEKGLGEALFGVAKGAFGAQAGANPFSTGGGAGAAAAANPFAKPAAASANPFSAPPPASSTPPTQQQQPAESTPTPTTATTTADTLPQTFAAALSLNNPQPPSGPRTSGTSSRGRSQTRPYPPCRSSCPFLPRRCRLPY